MKPAGQKPFTASYLKGVSALVTRLFHVCLMAVLIPSFAFAATDESSVPNLVKKIQVAVSTVLVYGEDGSAQGLGSGFFISKKGLFVTNHHRYVAWVQWKSCT